MAIGERIRKRRSELGMSATQLAYKLNKDRVTVYRYEKGEIENLPIAVLEPLSSALRTTPAYLMGWTDDPSPNKIYSSEVKSDEFPHEARMIARKYEKLNDKQKAALKNLFDTWDEE
ncbi:MAG: helix-turn-helix domain-containing protein [Clostridiales bacterium]|jgi:transcriptional regulator with XRE-family HTH domain|nr:helix-turn-helix domain-containing protein [Clostridiales bacterium]